MLALFQQVTVKSCNNFIHGKIRFSPNLHEGGNDGSPAYCTGREYAVNCQGYCPSIRGLKLKKGDGIAWFDSIVTDLSDRCQHAQANDTSYIIGTGGKAEFVDFQKMPSADQKVDWCPENIIRSSNGERAVMLGHYNRLLAVRLSLKRRLFEANPKGRSVSA